MLRLSKRKGEILTRSVLFTLSISKGGMCTSIFISNKMPISFAVGLRQR